MKKNSNILFFVVIIIIFLVLGGLVAYFLLNEVFDEKELSLESQEFVFTRQNFLKENLGGFFIEEKESELKSQEITEEEKIVKNYIKDKVDKKETKEIFKANWDWLDGQKKLYEMSVVEVNLILPELQERFPNKAERLKAISILRLGTPYQLGCLGEGAGKDKDPVFRLDVADCTVFVLTNVALLHSTNLKEAEEMMMFLNYRPKKDSKSGEIKHKITFENRLHFTTDRNEVSPYFRDITEEYFCESILRTKRVVLNKEKPNNRRLIDIDWEKETIIRYIPSQFITQEILRDLPKAIGIAFLRRGDEAIGLDVRHEGFLFNGSLFFHASSARGRVLVDDFFDYFLKESGSLRFDGIILFKIGA